MWAVWLHSSTARHGLQTLKILCTCCCECSARLSEVQFYFNQKGPPHTEARTKPHKHTTMGRVVCLLLLPGELSLARQEIFFFKLHECRRNAYTIACVLIPMNIHTNCIPLSTSKKLCRHISRFNEVTTATLLSIETTHMDRFHRKPTKLSYVWLLRASLTVLHFFFVICWSLPTLESK